MSSVDVQLITHCWKYSKALAYQMSGLVLDPPKSEVQLTVFFNDEDQDTVNTIRTLYPHLPVNVHLDARSLPKPQLFRRAIGRNIACLESPARTWTLCTDSDYIWSGTAIDEIAGTVVEPQTALIFPGTYWKQLSHALGDEYLARQATPQVLGLDHRDFEESSIDKAIGGIQLVRADVARKHGYLSHTKWMEPHTGPRFACCRCDRAYRGWIKDLGYDIKSVPGCMPYRIRHTKNGREVTEVSN